MRSKFFIFSICLICISLACSKTDLQPKPKAQLALNYEKANYKAVDLKNCPYQFEINGLARLQKPKISQNCWNNIFYPKQKGTIFITYNKLQNNLNEYLIDAQKLPLQHSIKADHIEASEYNNPAKNTYGVFYEVIGDAASQAQFYLTDSTEHFITGSIYFEATPNYDSILPAAEYLKKDIRHIMESMTWK